MFDYDLIVIGAGSAGIVAGIEARRLNFKVLMIEKNLVGGECLHSGCVPSKTLIKSAKVAYLAKRSPQFGLSAYSSQEVDLEKVMEHVRDVIRQIGAVEEEDLKKHKVRVLLGTPVFVDPHTVTINGTTISSKFFLISTGSRAAVPDVPGITEVGFVTNETLFGMKVLPKKFIVIGAGPIGVEMTQAFQRFGSEVILLQRGKQILPKEDEELARALYGILNGECTQIFTETKLLKVERVEDKKKILFQHANRELSLECDELLIASGRLPNVEGLNLLNIGVKVEKHGIVVDKHFRTSVPNIYACGDCIGEYLFTHMAGYQAKIAVYHALLALPLSVDYRVVPWAIFTDPELGRVGLTEMEARKLKGNKIAVYRLPFKEIDRAITDGETKGLIKVITDKKGYILGAHILGPSAGELLHEFVLAMKHRITLDKVALTIHVYPTLSIGLWQTADSRFQESLKSSPLIKFFRLLAPKL